MEFIFIYTHKNKLIYRENKKIEEAKKVIKSFIAAHQNTVYHSFIFVLFNSTVWLAHLSVRMYVALAVGIKFLFLCTISLSDFITTINENKWRFTVLCYEKKNLIVWLC